MSAMWDGSDMIRTTFVPSKDTLSLDGLQKAIYRVFVERSLRFTIR